jgi:hypothetical protein
VNVSRIELRRSRFAFLSRDIGVGVGVGVRVGAGVEGVGSGNRWDGTVVNDRERKDGRINVDCISGLYASLDIDFDIMSFWFDVVYSSGSSCRVGCVGSNPAPDP